MKKYMVVIAAGFLVLLIVPVLITQLTEPDSRRFEGVRVGDTDYREITFQNHEQNIELAGMLFVPEGDGPFPAAVIIHGSGTSVRDNGWYLTLTQHLQENGILVLYGENDRNVPTRRSAAILRSLDNKNIEVRIYEGSGHALESPEGEGNSILREDALSDIVDFVLSVSGTTKAKKRT